MDVRLGNAYGIAYDEHASQICFLSTENKVVETRIFSKSDIIECEVIEDGQSITKSATSNMIKRAVVGDILLGPAGAIIGGVTARRSRVDTVNRIELRVMVNDPSRPLRVITFLATPQKKGSPQYKEAIAKAQHWHALVSLLIRQADQEAPSVAEYPSQGSQISIVDELQKLDGLRTNGVIDEEEFKSLKTKIIQRA